MNANVQFEPLERDDELSLIERIARQSLAAWGLPANVPMTLLSLSENATYRLDPAGNGKPLVLRVHRPGYHTRNAIETELAWMTALQKDMGIKTPQAIPTLEGNYLVAVKNEWDERFVDLFEFIEGEAPDESELRAPFRRLGRITALLHRHARSWQRPSYFERLTWDYDGCLGRVANWGDWREAPGLDRKDVALLEQASETIRERLAVFGKGPERFGLIHSDLRLANLLETGGETRVIDFDDCGLGWFLYDLASALSFIETREDVPDLVRAWLDGYRTVSDLSADEEAEVPTFILLRRITLLAWIGSHPTADMAVEQGESFAAGTVSLAHAYLSQFCEPKEMRGNT
ncbi:MAG: phosphotransferase enzyme family protein [Pseudomonadota bacterium]